MTLVLVDGETSCVGKLMSFAFHAYCDRTTSDMRCLSPKIISGDSR
jgi:hypothetical protein